MSVDQWGFGLDPVDFTDCSWRSRRAATFFGTHDCLRIKQSRGRVCLHRTVQVRLDGCVRFDNMATPSYKGRPKWIDRGLHILRKGVHMLVLSRKPGERILIGDQVAVTIVRIGPNTVRIGIEAPKDMNIVREELCVDVEDRTAQLALPNKPR